MRKGITFLLLFTMLFAFSVVHAQDTTLKVFSDVDESTTYNGSIFWMADNQVIQGYEDGTFRPDDCVNRAEFLKLLFEMMDENVLGSSGELFSDTPEGQWYSNYIKKGHEKGTVEGYPDGSFKPAQCVNRAEAIKMAVLSFNNGEVPVLQSTLRKYYYSSDIDVDAWYYSYVDYVLASDLVGTEHRFSTAYSSSYGPGESMSRKEVAEMLYRMKVLSDNELGVFSASYIPEDFVEMTFAPMNPKLEEFFPAETMMVFTVDTQDATQKRYLADLLAHFPNGDLDEFSKMLIEEFNFGIDEYGITYESDVEPIFGDSYRMVMGILPNQRVLTPEMYIAITINSKSSLDTLINKLLASGGEFVTGEVFGFNVLSSGDDLNIAYTDNVLLITNTAPARYKALRRIVAGEPTLMDNPDFANSKAAEYEKYIGSMYIGFENYMDMLRGAGENYEYLNYEVLAAQAVSNGLKIFVEAKMDQIGGFNISDIELREPYMYENIPGNNLMVYSEGYNMSKVLELQQYVLSQALGMELDGEIMNSYSTYTSWITKGYALVAQDNRGSTFPAVSLYLDANGSLAEAKNALAELDKGVDLALEDLKSRLPEGVNGDALMVKKDVIINGRTFHKVTFDYSSLPVDSSTPSSLIPFDEITDQPVEFYYGITDKNYFVLTTYLNFDTEYNNMKSVKETSEVVSGMSNLETYSYGLGYVSVEETLDYVDKLIVYLEKVHGPMPSSSRAEYNIILEYFSPIKYIISGNKNVENTVEGLLFMKVGE